MELKPFIELMRRASKSKYTSVLMHNHMLLQCYSIDQDSDIGLHYILHIPDIAPYDDEFYDETLILNPTEILDLYKKGHTVLAEKKSEVKAKPKDVREELNFVVKPHYAQVKMQFIVQDELIDTQTYKVSYPVNQHDKVIENILHNYTMMLKRIKVGGYGVTFDGIRHGILDRAIESPRLVFFRLVIDGKVIRVPFYKSMFSGNNYDEFFVSVQETEVPMVFLFTIHLERKGIIEQFMGYLMNY